MDWLRNAAGALPLCAALALAVAVPSASSADVQGDARTLADTQVRFEARSGKTADAVSKGNGDAIVRMPASETWVRAGLRSGDDEPWQWFPIPPARAATRLVGFALTNIESVQPVPFKSFTLLVGPKGLVPADPDVELYGTYVKH